MIMLKAKVQIQMKIIELCAFLFMSCWSDAQRPVPPLMDDPAGGRGLPNWGGDTVNIVVYGNPE